MRKIKNAIIMVMLLSIFVGVGCENVFAVEGAVESEANLTETDTEGNAVTERMLKDNTVIEGEETKDYTITAEEETADGITTAGRETADKNITSEGEKTDSTIIEEEPVDNTEEEPVSIDEETAEETFAEESVADEVYQYGNSSIEEEVKAANGEFANAVNISIGNEVNGSITETNDERIYKFFLEKSGRITLDVTAYMRYCSLYIYDHSGELVWYDDWNEWNNNLKYFKDTYVVDLTNGLYYLQVTGYRNGTYHASTGSYTFATKFVSAEESCVEPNNDFREASVIGINGAVKGQIAENDTYDIYRFSLSKSGRIGLTMTSYMQFNSLYLYDSTGKEIWYDDWNEWNGNLKYRTDIYNLDLENGMYYLKVTGYRNGTYHASTGNYTLILKYTNANVNYREPNNDFSEAYAINSNTSVKGQIAINDPYDILSFSLPKARDIKLIMTSYMRYYTLAVYDNAGKQIWQKEWNEWNANVGYRKDTYTVALSAGNYYLKVTGYRNVTYHASTGTYILKVSAKGSMAQAFVYAPYYKEYTGKAQKPSVAVYCEGEELRKGKDYEVSYKNNKNIGEAIVIVKGKGDYAGTKKATFLIVPKKANITKVNSSQKGQITVNWKKDKTITGFQVNISRKKDFSVDVKRNEFKASKTGGTVGGLSRKKTYYVRMRPWKTVGRYRYYGEWSNVKKIKVK